MIVVEYKSSVVYVVLVRVTIRVMIIIIYLGIVFAMVASVAMVVLCYVIFN